MVENKFVIDSSVIVKWFKKGEEFEEEALRLRDDVLSTIINLTICELTPHATTCDFNSLASFLAEG